MDNNFLLMNDYYYVNIKYYYYQAFGESWEKKC